MKRTLPRILAILSALLLLCGTAGAEKTVMLTFTGDCTIGSDSSTYGRPTSFVTAAYEKGFDYFFANFREMFEADDCTVINLESVLSDYASNENKNKVYRFRGPREFVKILKDASVEACCLANNHSEDFGAQGLKRTQNTLSENDIGWFRLHDVYTFEKDGIRISMIAIYTTQLHSEYDWLRKEIDARSKRSNAVIVVFHGGTEYGAHRDEGQEKFAKQCIAHGADLVIMHHPHVVQGIEIINRRTVCYSLGNFVFGGNDQIREEHTWGSDVTSLYSLVVQAELHFDDDGTYTGQQVYLYPAFISGSYPANDYQPRLVTGADAKKVLADVQRDTQFKLPAFNEKEGRVVMPYLSAEK